ncbi:MAG: hypothetical protein ACKV0T_23010 [Planctomycetales bacterium]
MTKSCLTIVLVSLMLPLRVCVAADSPETEAWYVYVDKQVPYGSDPSTTEWRVEIGRDPVLAMGRLSLKGGERTQEEFAFPRYTMRRRSRQEAEQIQHRKLEGGDILMFDVDQPIARLDQLQAIISSVVFEEGNPANGPEGTSPDVKN